MFKKAFSITFLFLAIAFLARSIYVFSLSPCDRPTEYSIGRFDTQFGISEEQFKAYTMEAESVWGTALGKDVFVYNPDASFKINLIYDERQFETVQKERVESGLQKAEDVLKSMDQKLASLKSEYDALSNSHQLKIDSFKKDQKDYDTRVEYWNSRGGAPEGTYKSLQAEAANLNKKVAEINSEVATFNQKSKEINNFIKDRNVAAQEYNKFVANYNNDYGHGLEFNQAEYTGKEINVYQFADKGDLVLALSHEFGHALGMNHTENSHSIMYYITSGDQNKAPAPTAEDMAELNRVCRR